MAQQFYENQVLFVTGTSGNVGRVFLEKVLYSLSNIDYAYILIRKGSASSAYERLHEQILQTQAFNRIKQRHTNFKEFIDSKLVVVDGDVTQQNLGIAQETYQEICSKVTIVFGIAASTKYTETLDVAMQNNCIAVMNLLELVKNCPNAKCFVHTSTAYSMVHVRGQIEEEVYPTWIPAEQLFEQITNLKTKEEIKQFQSKIQQIWPDTYTFTKLLTENLLKARAGNLPIIICRLPSVGASWKEPYPGWVDTSTASTAWIFNAAIGGSVNAVFNAATGDTMPCDLCCNTMLASPYFYSSQPGVTVLNIVQSFKNKTTFEQPIIIATDYFRQRKNRLYQGSPYVRVSRNEKLFYWRQILHNKIPEIALNKIGQMLGLESFKEKAQKYAKRAFKEQRLKESFVNILAAERHFMARNVEYIVKNLSPEDKAVFNCDILDVPMIDYGFLFGYGVHRWIIKEDDIDVPIDLSGHDLNIKFTIAYNRKQYKDYLKSKRVIVPINKQELIQNLFEISQTNQQVARIYKSTVSNAKSTQKNYQELNVIAHSIAEKVIGQESLMSQKAQQLLLNQIQTRMFGRFIVDINRLRKIKQYQSRYAGPVIIVTPYRSKLDFLILKQVFYKLGIQQPFTIAFNLNKEFSYLQNIIRGDSVLCVEDAEGDARSLQDAIADDLLKNLIQQRQLVHIYIEGAVNNLGNIDFSNNRFIDSCTQLFYKKTFKNATFVPISIVYDKVLDFFSNQGKIQQLTQYLGNLHVHMGKKVQIGKVVFNSELEQVVINYNLKQAIVNSIFKAQAVTPIQIISSWILTSKQGQNQAQLQVLLQWTADFLKEKNYNIGELEACNIEKVTSNNLELFKEILSERIRGSFQRNKSNPKSREILQFYSEQIQHTVKEESLICMILQHNSLSIDELKGQYYQLSRVFKVLYHMNYPKDELSQLQKAIERLKDKQIIYQEGNLIKIDEQNRFLSQFFARFTQNYVDLISQVLVRFEHQDLQRYDINSQITFIARQNQKWFFDLFPYVTEERVRFILQFLQCGQILEEFQENGRIHLKSADTSDFQIFYELMRQYTSQSTTQRLEMLRNSPKASL